jgi:hypothetical protein
VRRPLLNAGRLVEIPTKEAAKDEIDSHRIELLDQRRSRPTSARPTLFPRTRLRKTKMKMTPIKQK